MDVEIVQREERWVLGVQVRIQPMDADYGRLWGEGFDPRQSEVTPLATYPGHYGVYYGSEVPGWDDFLMGMVVPEGTASPDALLLRAIPAGKYARFPRTMAAIGSTWGETYGQ